MHSDSGLRRVLVLGAFALLLAFLLAAPAVALAIPGDSPENAVALPSVPFTATGTLNPIAPADAEFWYTLSLAKGQTIETTLTTEPGAGYTILMVSGASFQTPLFLLSDEITSSVHRLHVMAPVTGGYFFVVIGGNVGGFTLEAATTTAVSYKLSGLSVPKKAKKKKAFKVSVNLTPDYDGLTSPIRFFVERRVGKKWKAYAGLNGGISGGNSSYTKLAASVKIAKRGTFRIRARFADAAHARAQYTGWKTVVVR